MKLYHWWLFCKNYKDFDAKSINVFCSKTNKLASRNFPSRDEVSKFSPWHNHRIFRKNIAIRKVLAVLALQIEAAGAS